MKNLRKFLIIFILFISAGVIAFHGVKANASSEIDSLQATINAKEARVNELSKKIDAYREKIVKQQAQSVTLNGEVSILENRIAKTELDIEQADEEIDLVNAQIALLTRSLFDLENTLEQDREALIALLRKIQVDDGDMVLKLFFGTDSFAELFGELQRLEQIQADVKASLERTEKQKDQLIAARELQSKKREQMDTLKATFEEYQERFIREQKSKEQLLSISRNNESEFQSLLRELRQEESSIEQEISELQLKVQSKIKESDAVGDSSIMTWPVKSQSRRTSAKFRDPEYPYRHLFQHSGVDMPAKQGTAVLAAAPGYVAWSRVGRQYGNYVMIIHTNGLATLYAHLSRSFVSADQFVQRGEEIGAVGSTGLSTGPHLNFEVRKNGIPTDPIPFLRDE